MYIYVRFVVLYVVMLIWKCDRILIKGEKIGLLFIVLDSIFWVNDLIKKFERIKFNIEVKDKECYWIM